MAVQTAPGRVLLVDDDPLVREALSRSFDTSQYVIATAADGASALTVAAAFNPEVILLDLTLPDAEGLDLISPFHELDELAGIVVLTATTDIATVVRAMQLGADNFLTKPTNTATIHEVLARTLERCRRDRRNRALLVRTGKDEGPQLIGSSRAMARVNELIAQVADTDATVLLEGESGTGKGIAADRIHRLSNRTHGPFLDMNCAALSSTLLESELFGYEKGAFTDATTAKAGLLEIASGGTVFLDEIGEMPIEVQSRLLKVLEDRRFRRLGGLRDLSTNVRLVTASNRDLKSMVRDGQFRKDLFYRLNVFAIPIPPLRARSEDILELAHHFLGELNRSMNTEVSGIDPAAADMLTGYTWPGNARELRNVIERAVILARREQIKALHLPADLRNPVRLSSGAELKRLAAIERDHIILVLEATGGNIRRSAKILDISRTTLYNKIRNFEIVVPKTGH